MPTIAKDKVLFCVSVMVPITQQWVDDVIAGALEGGINYWCDKAEVHNSPPGWSFASEVVSEGGMLRLHISEDYEKEFVDLDLANFARGLVLFISNHVSGINNGLSHFELDDLDANTDDLIVQYAVFGEIVFG